MNHRTRILCNTLYIRFTKHLILDYLFYVHGLKTSKNVTILLLCIPEKQGQFDSSVYSGGMVDTAKRANDDTQTNVEAPQQKRRKTAKTKKKDADAKDGQGTAGAPNLLYFEEQKEAALLIKDIESRRQKERLKGSSAAFGNLQLLSEWRLFQEFAKQQKDPAGGTGLSALRRGLEGSADTGKKILGFEPELLDVLQLGATSHLRDIVLGAAKVAHQRKHGSQKPDGFTVVEDVRIGLGEIRKRDQEEAKKLKLKREEELLKMASHRRADEETREMAQKLKEQKAGQQQAVAANKALAATLGGGDAKWMKWGTGSAKSTAAKVPEKNDDSGAQEEPAENMPETAQQPPVATGGSKKKSLEITLDDMVAYLESKPEYANSKVLFKLMNLKSMT